MQFKIDNGLCMIEDTKFETKDNIQIGTVKRVKYSTSYLDATIVGIGKYIVYLHINYVYNIIILLLRSCKGDKKTLSKIENNLLEQKISKTNKRKVVQSQIQSQEDKPSKKSRKTNSGGKRTCTSKKLAKQKVSAYNYVALLFNSLQSSIIIINIYVNNQQEDFKIICLGSPVKPKLTNVNIV